MKHNKYPQVQIQQPASLPSPIASADLNQVAVDLAPSPEAVARRAYFSYLNQGSLPGRDVQHWLAAEADLTAERNLTRIHGFHNKT